jgi:hypothetical protein
VIVVELWVISTGHQYSVGIANVAAIELDDETGDACISFEPLGRTIRRYVPRHNIAQWSERSEVEP